MISFLIGVAGTYVVFSSDALWVEFVGLCMALASASWRGYRSGKDDA